MAFLIHWNNGGTEITLCAASVSESSMLPDHLALAGVKGLSDATYPSIEIENLFVRRTDVVYIAEGPVKHQTKQPSDGPNTSTHSDILSAGIVDNAGGGTSNAGSEGQDGEKLRNAPVESTGVDGVQEPSRRRRYPRSSGESGGRPAC